MKLCEFAIAGVSFSQPPIRDLIMGGKLDIVREPQNEHDIRALRIDYGGIKFGYVPKPMNWLVLSLMEKNVEFRLYCARTGKNWVELHATFPEVIEDENAALSNLPEYETQTDEIPK